MSINNAARLKVAGGIAKGRRLESPDVFLRPMMAKVGGGEGTKGVGRDGLSVFLFGNARVR